MTPAAGAATTTLATSAVREVLAAHGSAVDAVIGGFFAEAGAHADVLLAPISAIVAGTGAGARAFDGRAVQPGKGIDRPRGILPTETPELVHRVAAPRTIGALSLMHASRGRHEMRTLAAHGVAAARDLGAARRAALIEDVGEAKATALAREPVEEALLATGGKIAGGALSRADLSHPSTDVPVLAAQLRASEHARVLRVPWAFDAGTAHPGSTEVIAAIDSWGLVAVLTYVRAPSLEVPGLQIALPCVGVPVLRGVERLAPGTPLSAPVPMAVLEIDASEGGRRTFAIGAGVGDTSSDARPRAAVASLDDDALAPLARAIPVDPAADELAKKLGGRFVCVALEPTRARVVSHHVAT